MFPRAAMLELRPRRGHNDHSNHNFSHYHPQDQAYHHNHFHHHGSPSSPPLGSSQTPSEHGHEQQHHHSHHHAGGHHRGHLWYNDLNQTKSRLSDMGHTSNANQNFVQIAAPPMSQQYNNSYPAQYYQSSMPSGMQSPQMEAAPPPKPKNPDWPNSEVLGADFVTPPERVDIPEQRFPSRSGAGWPTMNAMGQPARTNYENGYQQQIQSIERSLLHPEGPPAGPPADRAPNGDRDYKPVEKSTPRSPGVMPVAMPPAPAQVAAPPTGVEDRAGFTDRTQVPPDVQQQRMPPASSTDERLTSQAPSSHDEPQPLKASASRKKERSHHSKTNSEAFDESEMFGPGVTWVLKQKRLLVAGFNPRSPASGLGIKIGDVLREVNGVDVFNMEADITGRHSAGDLMLGQKGTLCKVKVLRVIEQHGQPEVHPITVTLPRAVSSQDLNLQSF